MPGIITQSRHQSGRRAARVWTGLAVAILIAFLTRPAAAQTVTYTIDPMQSSLALSGAVRYYFNGSVFGFAEQDSGSLVASYGGAITGDLAGSDLTFTGGSAITALANPAGPFDPAGPGTVDVYGMQTFSGSSASNRMYDIVLDLVGGTASDGLAFGGAVGYIGDSGGIFPFFSSINSLPPGTPHPLAGITASNTAATPVSLVTIGNVQTLTLPIDTNLVLFNSNNTGVETRLTGTLVATRVVPEPASALLVTALGSLLLARRRRAA